MLEDMRNILGVVWDGLMNMGWYILLGIAVSALIKTYKLDRRLWAVLNRGGNWVIVLAAFAGVFSPLCSCGILPIVVTLIEAGSPIGPAFALLMASPIVDPASAAVNYAALGPGLTAAKVSGALFMGLFAGFSAKYLTTAGWLPAEVFSGGPRKGYCDAKVDPAAPAKVPIDTVLADRKIPFFFARAKDTTLLVGKYILLALVVQGVIETYVPTNWIYAVAGDHGGMGVVYAALLGLPLPVNGLTVVPILKGLMHNGMGAGPAVAFLIAGPVSSIPAMLALLGMFRRRVFYLYMAVGFTGSVFLGYMFQMIL
ncbi:MAG: permease [Nitrospirae bacterium]|nr:permease [Nitrospirota bacterium]